MPTFGGSPTCPVCKKKVFFAEEVKCLRNSYHKFCLKCCMCNKLLDSSTVNDHEDSIYCRACYAKNFGPRGYGFAGGAAGLQTEGQPCTNNICFRTTARSTCFSLLTPMRALQFRPDMDRHFDKLSISASGLLGDRHNQPHHYQTLPQPHHYAQQQHQPVRQPQAPPSVYGSTRPLENGVRSQESGDAAEYEDQHEPVRQRTGRVRQSRSSTWGSGANGQASSTSATSATVAHAAELDETVDLRRRTPSQAESPRTPRTPGSPRYVTTGPDDQHHLAAISPRGAAGATSAHHSYQRRDRHPSSSSGGGGNLMVTEDDFRHAREANSHAVGGGSDFGWQQPARGGPEDVSTRLLQKYKTDSLRVEVTDADRRRQQQHPAGLSKSHDGFVVPRRLPPIGASSAANHEDYDDDDDIECDGGGDGSGGDGEANVGESQRRNQRRQQRQQRQHQDEDQSGGGHKGRTRTN